MPSLAEYLLLLLLLMAAPLKRGRKKVEVRAQQNKISWYFNVSKEKESHEIVLKLLDEMVFACCASPEELISDLLESLLSSIRYDGTKQNVRSKHDSLRVSSKKDPTKYPIHKNLQG